MSSLEGKKVFVTGGAGFIGSNLAEELSSRGAFVTVLDNLSLGKIEFIEKFLDGPSFRFVKEDLLNLRELEKSMAGHDCVFHMAANSDISRGTRVTDVDLRQGTLATYNVLEAMRINGIKEIVFASSSAVYGEPKVVPTPEDYGPLFPISLYGASKLACEGLISAFCHNFGLRAWIFRFGNIAGVNGTHGVMYDFLRKLREDPSTLEVLGDGNQSKPYLHVSDCVGGMLHGYARASEEVNCFNLACEGGSSVSSIAEAVVTELGLNAVEIRYTGGRRGWTGDVPYVRLDPSKMASLGWKARYSSDTAVRLSVRELLRQVWVGYGQR
ncbi:MAG TPA: NAD-dependent epimerase/dehydratase family protein [Thermodesulfobacteriota bacterium]|nr:NAD-dependent epimerase/dehydratase family protein [Thermodesulfobacteriota bacterium]